MEELPITSDQKVAIITGGNSGIGRATAVALAKEGVKVVIAARREKEGEETVQLVKDAGSDGVFVKTDVTNEDDIKALVDRTVQVYGNLDYALNNAVFDINISPSTVQLVGHVSQSYQYYYSVII